MPADFLQAAKAARSAIPVPALNLESIRRRSQAERASDRWRRALVCVAASLGLIGGAVALAANLNRGIHVWMFGNKIEANVTSFAQVREPMRQDVRRIVEGAAFHVLLPAGVPNDLRVLWIGYTPAAHPTTVTISYVHPSGAPGMGISLFANSALDADKKRSPNGPAQSLITRGVHFTIGDETVLVQGPHVSQAQVSRIERAMRSQTAAQAEAALDSQLPKVAVLDAIPSTPVVIAAEGRAPLGGTSLLLGPWALHEIPARAAGDQPLRDPRSLEYLDIPNVHGRPDYRNARMQWRRNIAIPAAGVRVIEAMLRRAGIAPDCACQVLVHGTGPATYEGWRIDAKTLKATRI